SAAAATSREGHLSGFHPVAPHAPECLGAFVIWTDFKCPTRSTLQIRCRRTALRARRSRIRAPITGKHDVSSLFQMDCENRSAVAHPKLRRSSDVVATSRAGHRSRERKPSFDPRIAGLEEILRAPDCVFPKWTLQASLPLSRRN